MSRPIAAVIVLLWLCTPAHAEIYQWKDAEGKVHFTDKPPANQKAQTLDIRTAPSAAQASPPPEESAVSRQRKLLQTIDEEKALKAEQQQKQQEARQKQDKNCAMLREQQRLYNEGGRFYNLDKNGERQYHTDDEIDRQHAAVNKALEKCR
ncbi:MAG TPA: DUF4124 domain-containing protein [Fluviicoccus sp.]|nr:DUF4124 domain-containing protein [Fluviicoccus sp.]